MTAVPLRLDAVERGAHRHAHHRAGGARRGRAALAGIEPLADLHASADYRRRAAAALAVRAIMDAPRARPPQARGAHAR